MQARIRLAEARYPNRRWSMDFVSDRSVDERWFRILTVLDQYTRECLCAHADRSQSGEKVAEQLERVIAQRGVPETITADNGSEFAGRVMDYWAHSSKNGPRSVCSLPDSTQNLSRKWGRLRIGTCAQKVVPP